MKEEKLTLEHLAPYLPYNLQLFWNGKTIPFQTSNIDRVIYSQISGKNYKPIMRSLSDLAKEIEHNGEKLNPMIELAKIEANGFKEIKGNYYISDDYYCIDYSDSFGMNTLAVDIVDTNFSASRGYIGDSCRNQFKLFNWLYKHHFAVNIPEHLYIDINTI